MFKQIGKQVVGVNLFPGMNTKILDAVAQKSDALVLFTNAGGGIANSLLPELKRIIDEGKPVLVLTDNVGSKHGVVELNDQPQVDAEAIGVTYLEKINIENNQELYLAISDALDKGLRGRDLAQYIQEKFKFPKGEKPKGRLGTEEGLEDYKSEIAEFERDALALRIKGDSDLSFEEAQVRASDIIKSERKEQYGDE